MVDISLIIPLYNAEKYLPCTLESVVNQNFNNFEVIIIDDGSSDNSYDICRNFAKNYSYIKLFKQKNSGTIVARKNGAEKAKGRYLFFLDADDTLNENCLKSLYEVQESTNADITIGSYWRQNEEGKIIQKGNSFRKGGFWDSEDIISITGKNSIIDLALKSWRVSGEPLFGAFWARLFKKSTYLKIMKKIDKHYTICEDLYFYVKLLKELNHVVIVNKPLYLYTVHDNATSLSCSFFNQSDHLDTFKIMKKYIIELLVNTHKMTKAEAIAQAYETISYQLIGNFVYNFKYYNKENKTFFYKKTLELLNSEIVEKAILHHKVLDGYSKLIPFLMKMKWARLLIFVCKQRAKNRYTVKK